jgi:hypothetical protein
MLVPATIYTITNFYYRNFTETDGVETTRRSALRCVKGDAETDFTEITFVIGLHKTNVDV